MSDSHFDWQRRFTGDTSAPAVVDSRRRMRLLLAGFVLLLATVMARAIALEVNHGEAFRRHAAEPLRREVVLPASRGRILARDDTVLAEDQGVTELTVAYRVLQTPVNPAWIRRQARGRLSRQDRSDATRVEEAQAAVEAELAVLHKRLAQIAGTTADAWNARRRRIEYRIERIAESVNARHQGRNPPEADEFHTTNDGSPDASWLARAGRWFNQIFPPPRSLAGQRIVVAEQVEHHAMATDLSPEAVRAVRRLLDEDEFARQVVALQETTRRVYPHGATAAHVLGHVGAPTKQDRSAVDRDDTENAPNWVGQLGIERKYERSLRGTPGLQQQRVSRSREVLESIVERPIEHGQDVQLTLDLALQRSAENLLDSALARRRVARSSGDATAGKSKPTSPGGGAIVVMDCQNGAICAAASGPRFDPNIFTRGDSAAITAALTSGDHALLNRVTQMTIPPGSVMKALTAVALLEEGTVTATESFHCQGYLHTPERQRCALYRRQGLGHEELTLGGALARSCNVYFFHHAPRMGGRALTAWAERFGLGRATGVELPSEAAGRVPTPEWTKAHFGRSWRDGDTQSLSVGQGSLTVTPLQVARAVAAIANGGHLVLPHVVAGEDGTVGQHIMGLHEETLRVVHRGMRQAVSDPEGTAHRYLALDDLLVAAKTGTAESGGGRAEHAWLVGYAPADAPRFVFVIALEHSGNAGPAAGPVARRLLQRMRELGYFASTKVAQRR